jgi:NtrC-family two-component system response regulator AlgB
MKILIVDDGKDVRNATSLSIQAGGHEAEIAGSGRVALRKLREEIYDIVFLNPRLGDEDGIAVMREIRRASPSLPVVVFTDSTSIDTAEAAMRAGASECLTTPFTPGQLQRIVERVGKSAMLERRIESLEGEMAGTLPRAEFTSDDPRVSHIYDVLFRAARSPASLLILGESGTGKSLAARAVHARSHLADGPFVTVNCPGLSGKLLESGLFGHLKGSFAGAARDAWGSVAGARGGTLFLDEIGELPLDIQPKLLRLLQEREYERLGGSWTHRAEVRVIAATNRDLAASVAAGTFREDLYHRLNTISVTMPPLRQRPGDLLRLARHFLEFFARQIGREIEGFTPDAKARLLGHSWPGNVRELRNVIEHATILSRGGLLTAADLFDLDGAGASHASGAQVGALVSIEQLEREHIERVLAVAGSQEAAARILGIDPATLYRKRKKWERASNA